MLETRVRKSTHVETQEVSDQFIFSSHTQTYSTHPYIIKIMLCNVRDIPGHCQQFVMPDLALFKGKSWYYTVTLKKAFNAQ